MVTNVCSVRNNQLKEYLKVDDYLKNRKYSLDKKQFRDVYALSFTNNNAPVFLNNLPVKAGYQYKLSQNFPFQYVQKSKEAIHKALHHGKRLRLKSRSKTTVFIEERHSNQSEQRKKEEDTPPNYFHSRHQNTFQELKTPMSKTTKNAFKDRQKPDDDHGDEDIVFDIVKP